MRKLLLLAVTVAVCAAILYVITRPPAKATLNEKFTRNYAAFSLHQDTTRTFDYRIDQITAWGKGFVFYSIYSRTIGVMDSIGNVFNTVSYLPPTPASTIHSISVTPHSVYCFDLNGRVAGETDVRDTLRFTDKLPFDTRGAVLNNRHGYTMLRFNSDSGRLFLYDSIPGEKPVTLFAFEQMRDRGFSNWSVLQKSQDGENVFHVPMYNSRIIRYQYSTHRVSVIETIEKTPVTDLSVGAAGGTMLSSKTPVVNRRSCANARQLFVLSFARSGTDPAAEEIIDVYDLSTNRYAGSFTIPAIPKGNIHAMACNNNRLAIVQGNSLIIFTLYEKQ